MSIDWVTNYQVDLGKQPNKIRFIDCKLYQGIELGFINFYSHLTWLTLYFSEATIGMIFPLLITSSLSNSPLVKISKFSIRNMKLGLKLIVFFFFC